MQPLAHFKTITHHRHLVCRYCFRLGLYRQGLLHDLSKYAPCEFWRGAKYYQGYRSPNDAERKRNGVSLAWLHHKGRNRHHYEYWVDMKGNRDATLEGKPMPTRYVVEMFCDRMAASKVYQGSAYTDASSLEYLRLEQSAKGEILMHPDTKALLERMLTWLAEDGEEIALRRVRNEIVKPRHREPNTPKF